MGHKKIVFTWLILSTLVLGSLYVNITKKTTDRIGCSDVKTIIESLHEGVSVNCSEIQLRFNK